MNKLGLRKLKLRKQIPLALQIVIAIILAIVIGSLLNAQKSINPDFVNNLAIPCTLILKALRTLATPLILFAVLHAFITADIPQKSGRKLAVLLLTNTTVAICIGLFVANVLKPGSWGHPATTSSTTLTNKPFDPWGLIQDIVPDSILKPLVDNNVIQLIVVALAFGLVLRTLKAQQVSQGLNHYLAIEQIITILFQALIKILHWIVALVPLAVLGIVAKTIALQGFAPFKPLGAFIISVLLALFLQACYYLLRLQFGSWVKPKKFLIRSSEALLTAFSTASSTATIPIAFEILLQKIGLRQSSASLGALVGSNFNHDGTALYEAMSALFITQILGWHLSLLQQLIVVLTSMFASVGAAGIPEAGLVTMTLVFNSVGLPTQYIALLVTIDWFLDRCRTMINLMGDMTVSCLLDGKQRQTELIQQDWY
jgi:DAACS family dicarboxylate/amino acid:cation (Na+ or H+) symporter